MKKIYIMFLIIFMSFMTGCNSIKEYSGTNITKLTYTTIDYNGGYTNKYVFDFNENTYSSVGYLPSGDENPTLELKNTFTDEKEKIFIDECYTYGLFDLKESYKATGIIDGGGWDLVIEYEDGSTKTSRGDNASPNKVFNKCATSFYDLCGDPIVGILPEYYVYPPNVSYAFHCTNGNSSLSTNELARVIRANYKWNKSESTENNIYLLNEEVKDKSEFIEDVSYELVLYTSNYNCDEKFNKIVVKEYDYNEELLNQKIIYEGKWIKQIELEIQINKIYVYELSFKDGDYVQYTFNTYCDIVDNSNTN